MQYVHVRNLEKYHPGYQDRELKFAKLFFTSVQGDPQFEIITNEIDKWRFVAMICLELEAKSPLPNTTEYWVKKFDVRKRPMSLTLQMLQNFIEVRNGDKEEPVTDVEDLPLQEESETCDVDGKSKKVRVRGLETDTPYVAFEKATVEQWNRLCDEYPILSKIKEVSGKRREMLKKRYERESFRDFQKILECVKQSPFLLGEGPRKWKVSFDWLIKNDTNYLRVLEGAYAGDSGSKVDEIKAQLGLRRE